MAYEAKKNPSPFLFMNGVTGTDAVAPEDISEYIRKKPDAQLAERPDAQPLIIYRDGKEYFSPQTPEEQRAFEREHPKARVVDEEKVRSLETGRAWKSNMRATGFSRDGFGGAEQVLFFRDGQGKIRHATPERVKLAIEKFPDAQFLGEEEVRRIEMRRAEKKAGKPFAAPAVPDGELPAESGARNETPDTFKSKTFGQTAGRVRQTMQDKPEKYFRPYENGFWDSYVGDLTQRAAAGGLGMYGNTFKALDNAAKWMDERGIGSRGGIFGDIADWGEKSGEDLLKRSARYEGKSFMDFLGEGRYAEAAGEIGLTAAESTIPSAVAMIYPQVGMPAIMLGAGQAKYDELTKSKPDMPENEKLLNATLTGIIEGASEGLGNAATKIAHRAAWRGAVKKLGEKGATDAVKKSILQNISSTAAKLGIATGPLMEGLEEVASQTGENFVDIITDADPNRKMSDGVLESFVYGAAGGAQFSAAAAPGIIRSAVQRRQITSRNSDAANGVRRLFGSDAEGEIASIDGAVDGSRDATVRVISDIYNSGMPDDRKQAAIEYAVTRQNRLRLDAARGQQALKIAEQATEAVSPYINPATNTLMTGTIDGVGEDVILFSQVSVGGDGTVDREASDGQLIYADPKTGQRKVTSIDRLRAINENTPREEAVRQATEAAVAPLVEEEENDEVRPYNTGETVRTVNGFYGQITAVNDDGSYTVAARTARGVEDVTVQPLQIVNEDNITGISDGDMVSYVDPRTGETRSGEVSGLANEEMRLAGVAEIDSELVPIENISGKADSETGGRYDSASDEELSGALSDINDAIESGVVAEEQLGQMIEERDRIASEIERRGTPGNVPENGTGTLGTAGTESVNTPPDIAAIRERAPKQENGETDYEALLIESPDDFVALTEGEFGAEGVRDILLSQLGTLDETVAEKREALKKKTGNEFYAGAKEVERLRRQREAIAGIVRERYGQPQQPTTAEAGEIRPVGKGHFGSIYDQFRGKAKEAIDFLAQVREGDAIGVFHRNELGDIDLVWGNAEENNGLEHIIDKHIIRQNDFDDIEEAANIIDDVINNGEIVKDNSSKATLEKDGYKVVISKNVRDKQGNIIQAKNWIVTAFDITRTEGEKRNASPVSELYTAKTTEADNGQTTPLSEASMSDKRGILWNASAEHSAPSAATQDFPATQLNTESGAVSALSQSSPLSADKGNAKNPDMQKESEETSGVEGIQGETEQIPSESEVANNLSEIQAGNKGIPAGGQSNLSESEANALIAQMEANAAEAPVLELTPENWEAEFGEDGMVKTPVGNVKMGDNQYRKIIKNGRQKEFGMIKPTLTNPDVILEVASEAKEGQETERPSSYLFVKTFKYGEETVKFFTSITVSKQGLEVIISNHIENLPRMRGFIRNGKLLYQRPDMVPGAEASGPASTGQSTEADNSAGASADKDNANNSNDNIQPEESRKQREETQAGEALSVYGTFTKVENVFEKYNPDGYNRELTPEEAETVRDILTYAKENGSDPVSMLERLNRMGYIHRGHFASLWHAEGGRAVFAEKVVNDLGVRDGEDVGDKGAEIAEAEKQTVNPTDAQIEGVTLLTSEYWDDNSLKDSPDFRKRVNDFLESVDNEIIIRTVLGVRDQFEGTPRRAFNEEFIVPYALGKGLVEKKKGKNRYERVSQEEKTETTTPPQEKPVEERLANAGGDILSFAKNETKRSEISEAERRTDSNPSEVQKEAGNYRMGHVDIQGFNISIENPKGSVRSGVDESGKPWSVTMNNTYGYIRGTEGRDHDQIDVFLGENPESGKVFVVDQMNPETGRFDEHKVMMGFDGIEQAREAYLSNYEEGWQGLGDITETAVEDFRKWAGMEGRRIKPFAEYKSVREVTDETRKQQLNDRIKEIDGLLSKIRRTYFDGVKGLDNIRKAEASMNADPEYKRLTEEESKAWVELARIDARLDRAFLEGELPSRLPKKSEKLLIAPESPIFTEDGGIVNIRPIVQKVKKVDAKTALLSVAEDEKEVYNHAMKGIFHDAGNGVDVVTDGHILMAVPNGNNKKTWTEGRDGKEIEGKFPNWKSVIPDNAIKIKANGMQPLIDRLAGAVRAGRFVDNVIAIQFDVNGEKVFFNPEYLLKTASAMQGTGSNSAVFEFNGSPKRPLIIRDAGRQDKFALIKPMTVEREGRKTLIVPVELGTIANETEGTSGSNGTKRGRARFQTEQGGDLEAVNGRFNEELQQQIDGTLPKGHVYKLGAPSEILQSVGMPNLSIELTAEKLAEKASEDYVHSHPFELSEVKDLPKAIQNPLAVFSYGDKSKAVNIITEIEQNGKKFLVGISMNPVVNGKKLSVNSIRSIFPKDTHEWAGWINQGKGLYYNKEKVLDFLTNSRHPTDVAFGFPENQVQQENSKLSEPDQRQYNSADVINSATKIVQDFENPKLPEEKMQSSDEKMQSVPERAWRRLIERLRRTGLARDVIADKAAYQREWDGQKQKQPLTNGNGTVYGFVTADGTVYLDPDMMNANTPIHEFGHLWNDFVKKDNPELWARGKTLIENSPYWDKVNNNPAYAGLSEEAKADEALAMAIGDKGETMTLSGDVLGIARLRTWLSDLWKWIGEHLGFRSLDAGRIENLTLEDFVNGAVADLLSGEEIPSSRSQENGGTGRDGRDDGGGRVAAQSSTDNPSSLEGLEIIEAPRHDFKNFKEAEDWARGNIVGTYNNRNTGEDIHVSNNSVKKYLSGKAVNKSVDKDAHLSALKQIPRLIESSVLREVKQDDNNNPDIKEIQRLYGAIHYEGENYPVKITVKAYQTGENKAYSYEVMQIESPVGNLNARQNDIHPSNTGLSVNESRGKDTTISENNKQAGEKSTENDVRFQVAGNEASPPAYREGEPVLDYAKRIADWRKKHAGKVSGTGQAINRTKVQIAELRTRLRNMRGNVSSVKQYIREHLSRDMIAWMGEREFNAFLGDMEKATATRDMERVFMHIDRTINDIELREYSTLLSDFLKMKVSERNDRGVSVAKNVDEETRRMVEYINENKGMSEDAISDRTDRIYNEYIAANQNREGEGEMTPEQIRELESLEFLRRQALIKALADNISEIDKESKNISTKTHKDFIENRQARSERKKALEKERIAAQRELIDATKEAVKEMSRIIDGGKRGLSGFVKEQKDHRLHVNRIANAAVANGKDWSQAKRKAERSRKVHLLIDGLNNVKNFALGTLNNFNTMLKLVDTNNLMGTGRLYDYFMLDTTGVMAAGQNYRAGMRGAKEELQAAAKRITGKSLSHLVDRSRKKAKGVSLEYLDKKGVRRNLPMSYGELLYLYSVGKMADGRIKLERMGIDEAAREKIAGNIPQSLRDFMDWVQSDFLPGRREKYNETHKKMFGSSMAKIEGYFPLRYDIREVEGKEKDIADEDIERMPSSVTGAIINRVRHGNTLDLSVNAFDVLVDNMNEMEEWSAYAPVRRDVNAVLNSQFFKNSVEANMKGSYKMFKDAARVAVRSYKSKNENIDRVAGMVNRRFAAGAIGFRLATALKQVLSYPAFMGYSVHPAYQTRLVQNALPVMWIPNWQWAMKELPGFKDRWDSGNMGDEKLMEQATKTKAGKAFEKAIDISMFPNRLIDAVTVVAGAKSVYDYQFGKNKKAGMDEAEAKRRALISAAVAYNETQQSALDEFLSPTQKSGTALARAATTFQNANYSFMRKEVESVVENYRITFDNKALMDGTVKKYIKNGMSEEEARKKARGDLAKAFVNNLNRQVIFGFALGMIWRYGLDAIMGTLGDDDDELEKDMLTSLAISPVDGTVMVGQFLDAKRNGYDFSVSIADQELQKLGKDFLRAVDEEGLISWDALYATGNIGLRAEGINLESLSNIYKGFDGMIKDGSVDANDVLTVLNYPKTGKRAYAAKIREGEGLIEYANRIKEAYANEKLFNQHVGQYVNKYYFHDADGDMTEFNRVLKRAKRWEELRKAGDESDEFEELNKDAAFWKSLLNGVGYLKKGYKQGVEIPAEKLNNMKGEIKGREPGYME